MFCPDTIVDCMQGCGKTLPRKKLNHHHDTDCPYKKVSCPSHELGCLWKGCQNDDLDEHIKGCMFVKLGPFLFALLDKNSELHRETQSLKRLCTKQEEQIDRLKKDIEKQDGKLENMKQAQQHHSASRTFDDFVVDLSALAKLDVDDCIPSKDFLLLGHKWHLEAYKEEEDFGLYLQCSEGVNWNLKVDFTLFVDHMAGEKYRKRSRLNRVFKDKNGWGKGGFLDEFLEKNLSDGFLFRDQQLRCGVTIHSIVKKPKNKKREEK